MNDPQTVWLTVTNIALGAAVFLLVVIFAAGTLTECIFHLLKRRELRRELDADLAHFLSDAPMSGKSVPTGSE